MQSTQAVRLSFQLRQGRRQVMVLAGPLAQLEGQTDELAAGAAALDALRQSRVHNRRAARHRRRPGVGQMKLETERADLQHIRIAQRLLVDGLSVEPGGVTAAGAVADAQPSTVRRRTQCTGATSGEARLMSQDGARPSTVTSRSSGRCCGVAVSDE